jgi:hypothetical protein
MQRPTFLMLLHEYLLSLNMFTEQMPINDRFFWLQYSSFQSSYHIVPSLRLIILNSLQAYRHLFLSEGTRL